MSTQLGGKSGTALYRASRGGHAAIVNFLLDNGAKLNTLERLKDGLKTVTKFIRVHSEY